jgi:hypothetical protein
LSANLPEQPKQNFRSDSRLSDLCDQIAAGIPESEGYSTESSEYFRLMLRVRERPFDKFRFVSRLAFTPSVGEWSTVRLPAALFPLYRGVRIVRLATRMFSTPAEP